MAGSETERQEHGFISAVKKAFIANKKNPVTLVAGGMIIKNVIDAKKFSGRQASGSEPYTDVILMRKVKGAKPINISMKGDAAPSLGGGGLSGIEAIIPGIGQRFLEKALHVLLKVVRLNPGDKVPDVYGKLDKMKKIKVIVGNTTIGGPIDFVYMGGMEVKSKYDPNRNIISFINGTFYDATQFAITHDLYFRLRARRDDQRFDPTLKDTKGFPRIYGRSPSKGDVGGRIVVTSSVGKDSPQVEL